jgi:hypothetical protein
MKMSGNLAKRKRCVESDDDLAEQYQNDTHFVHFDKFGKGIISSNSDGTGQVLVDQVGNSKVGGGFGVVVVGGGSHSSKEVLVAEDSMPCDSDSGAPVIKQVTTVAFLSGGTSPKKYKGGPNAQQGARDESKCTRRVRDAEEVGGKEEMPTEQPNNLLVNPELESSPKKKEDLAAEKLGRKPGSRKLEGKPGSRKLEGNPDAEEPVGQAILALEHTSAPSNMVKPVLPSSNILLFSVGQTGQTAQQVKKTNKRSKFKFTAGENHINKYFSHKGSAGGVVGSTKTKAGETVCLEQVQEVNSHKTTSLSNSPGNPSELSGSCENQNHYPSNAQTIHINCDQGLSKAETS